MKKKLRRIFISIMFLICLIVAIIFIYWIWAFVVGKIDEQIIYKKNLDNLLLVEFTNNTVEILLIGTIICLILNVFYKIKFNIKYNRILKIAIYSLFIVIVLSYRYNNIFYVYDDKIVIDKNNFESIFYLKDAKKIDVNEKEIIFYFDEEWYSTCEYTDVYLIENGMILDNSVYKQLAQETIVKKVADTLLF